MQLSMDVVKFPGSQQSARRNLAGWKLSPLARIQKLEDEAEARELGLPVSRVGERRRKEERERKEEEERKEKER